jgi:glycosyltransferase involved in cell wall biosynthesis
MKEPLISIIVPVYNPGDCLDRAIAHVLNQFYDNLEAIIVDDGTTDEYNLRSLEFYKKNDSRVKLIHIPHSGVTVARNVGLKAATGEFVMFIDSDDVASYEIIGRLYELLKIHGDSCDMVAAKLTRFEFMLSHDPFRNRRKVYSMTGREAYRDMLYQHNVNCSLCGKIFRRRLFDNNTFNEEYFYEDLEWMCRVLPTINKYVVTNERLYNYRKRRGSVTNSFSSHSFDAFYILEKVAKHDIQDSYLRNAVTSRLVSAAFNVINTCYRYNHHNKQLINRCWDVIRASRKVILLDPKIRLKNKLGILLYLLLGRLPFKILSKHG